MDFGAMISSYLFAILLVNGLLALIPAYIANEKGRSFGAFWTLSFFTTVLIGLIAVLAMPQRSADHSTERNSEKRPDGVPSSLKCPYCAEFIKSEAKICKYCGKSVEAAFAIEIESNRAALVLARAQQAEAAKLRLQAQIERENERKLRRSSYLKKTKSPVGIAFISVLVLAVAGFGALAVGEHNANLQAIAEEKELQVVAAEIERQQREEAVQLKKVRVQRVKQIVAECGIERGLSPIDDPVTITSTSIQVGNYWGPGQTALACLSTKLREAGIPSKKHDYFVVIPIDRIEVP
jgi:hypothetical protein